VIAQGMLLGYPTEATEGNPSKNGRG